MTRYQSAEAQAHHNAYKKEYNRQKSPEEDFMYNLHKMGKPSAVVEHDEQGRCLIGRCPNWSEYTLVYPTDAIEICKRHERMRQKGKTR